MPSNAGSDKIACERIDRRDLLTGLTGLTGVGAVLAAGPAVAAGAPPRRDAARGLRMAYADGPWGQIHYRQVAPARPPASGLPLLCLHASPLSSLVYDHWLLEIGRDRIAVAPDTPGYGSSAAPPARPAIGDYAEAMLRFMDELGLRQVDVMGYHTGALTSVELARRHPERVRHVVQSSFAGRRVVIFSGGPATADAAVLDEARAIREGGGFGSIIGRNSFQRQRPDALKLLGQIMDIYAS